MVDMGNDRDVAEILADGHPPRVAARRVDRHGD
jgi:hypothetical protein